MEGGLDLFAMASAIINERDSEETHVHQGVTDEWLSELCARENVGIDAVEYQLVDAETFKKNFILTSTPVVILGCTESWNVNQLNSKALESTFGDVEFALFNGQKFPLSEYLRYVNNRGQDDPNPLYLFEDLSFVSPYDAKSKILDYYSVPKYFSEDIFDLGLGLDELEDLNRPRFRWILIGPSRSGTTIHSDPFSTSAWNTLLEGKKRWVLIPPSVEKEVLGAEETVSVSEWFSNVLPNLRKNPDIPVVEFTQKPGETVFVPAGWWHIVINIGTTLAVTQNFASPNHLQSIVSSLYRGTNTFRFTARLMRHLRVNSPGNVIPVSFSQCIGGNLKNLRYGLWDENDKDWLKLLESRFNLNGNQLLSSEKKIPKIIHQIWLGPNSIPEFAKQWIESWKEINENWEYRIWLDSDVKEFGLKNSEAFERATNYGEKSDIARYEILNEFGGVYVDIDFECLQELQNLIELKQVGFIAGMSNVRAVELNNGFIASVPKHPLIESLIAGIKWRPENDYPKESSAVVSSLIASMLPQEEVHKLNMLNDCKDSKYPAGSPMDTISRTGPGYFTRRVFAFLQDIDISADDVLILPPTMLYPVPNSVDSSTTRDEVSTYVRPETVAIHHWAKTWVQS